MPHRAPERYRSLDAWRGLAAFGVVLAHTYPSCRPLAKSVQVFFVISGYCLAAALDRAAGDGLGSSPSRRASRGRCPPGPRSPRSRSERSP